MIKHFKIDNIFLFPVDPGTLTVFTSILPGADGIKPIVNALFNVYVFGLI